MNYQLGLRVALFSGFILFLNTACASDVTFQHNKQDRKIEISVGGLAFTTYCYGEEFFDKPVFYPLLTAAGIPVNRMYPMVEGIEGESTDHVHHQSVWFTYGEVNGVDYWNRQAGGRRIKHREIRSMGGDRFKVTLDWIDLEGVKVLREDRVVTFGGGADVRWMDWRIALTANETDVHFGDSKEGAFGLRVAGSLREKDRTGRYFNAQGAETSKQCWGQPSEWVALTGEVEGAEGEEEVTIAIFSHPTSYNHPPYWHARDYGLFTANPFGRKGYQSDLAPLDTRLERGERMDLRFRLAVYEGKVGKLRLDRDYDAFSNIEP